MGERRRSVVRGDRGLAGDRHQRPLAYLFKKPLLFPSLGPSVFLFFETPLAPNASPRNTLIGHGVGLLGGLIALALFGLSNAPSVLEGGVTPARIAAAAFAVALTSGILVGLRVAHPPAGATTLIVALGLITGAKALVFIPAGVILITVVSTLMNRALGVRVPLWSAEETASSRREVA